MMISFLFLLVAFLVGSTPVGYLVGRCWGLDIRKLGSGNVGATNVKRTCGQKAGYLTLVLDILKGFVAVTLLANLYGTVQGLEDGANISAFFGLAAILGHCYSPFLNFRGGKGVATSIGVFIVLCPAATVVAVFVYLAVRKYSGFVSLGSLSAALALPLANYFLFPSADPSVFWVSALIALLIVVRHKDNIRRLINKEELRA